MVPLVPSMPVLMVSNRRTSSASRLEAGRTGASPAVSTSRAAATNSAFESSRRRPSGARRPLRPRRPRSSAPDIHHVRGAAARRQGSTDQPVRSADGSRGSGDPAAELHQHDVCMRSRVSSGGGGDLSVVGHRRTGSPLPGIPGGWRGPWRPSFLPSPYAPFVLQLEGPSGTRFVSASLSAKRTGAPCAVSPEIQASGGPEGGRVACRRK